MSRAKDYQSAFDIIGPVMIGPSSSHTAGAVKIGQATRSLLHGTPEHIVIHYYESFAKTHDGHGTDHAILGGLLGYSTFDERIRDAIETVKSLNIPLQIIEEEIDSIGDHPNCALIKAQIGSRRIELNGISIGGGTIKIKSIEINGLMISLDHTLPLLVIDGHCDRNMIGDMLDDLYDMNVQIEQEIKSMDNDQLTMALHLDRPMLDEAYNEIKEKYSQLTFSYIS